MEQALKLLNRLDWAVALGCLGYGALTRDVWWVAAGALAVGVAWYNPSLRVQGWLGRRLLATPKRAQATAARASAVRIAQDEEAYAAASAAPPTPNYGRRVPAYGPAQTRLGPHNLLQSDSANMASATRRTWC